ncbi:uncharacterized protein LOC106062139 [Biomphalaria glabrata]|uniref:Uncharacterized protein LOC106062139 n=1 Tax=Biomphalaria glabrata TaxID=6526 RepID=A0A9W2YRE7_BIOGL|nr:uncharacterized protein LOC106062139 [Biomphalaria glabrata]
MANEYYNIVFLLLFGCFDDLSGTSIQLNPYIKESYSNCNSGFLHGIDRYIYNGTVDITSYDLSTNRFIDFEMQQLSSNDYIKICRTSLYPNCDPAMGECYCRIKSNSLVELFLNKTADIRYSNGTLRITWPKFTSLDETSNEVPIPIIYTNTIEILEVNSSPVNLDKCESELKNSNLIEFCVKGLSAHALALNISSTSTQSQNECIHFTYTYSNTDRSPINFNISYLEQDGCKRTKSTICYLNNVSTANITTTVNTTTDLKTTTASSDHVTQTPSETMSEGLTGVLTAHVVCTVIFIVLSVMVLVNVQVFMQRQQKGSQGRPKHLNLLIVLLTLFELAQIILVIIAGVKFSGEGGTSLDIWKIMIIYQVVVLIIVILAESILLCIKTCGKHILIGSPAFHYVMILICIHTVLGIIFIPFFIVQLRK